MEKKKHRCLQILIGGGGGQVGGGEHDWPSRRSSHWFLFPFPVNLTQDDLQLVANSALGPEI